MAWVVDPIWIFCVRCSRSIVQVILKNERNLFGEFARNQADNVLKMSTLKSKRGSDNDRIAVILGVNPWMVLELTLLTMSSILLLLVHVIHTYAILSDDIPKKGSQRSFHGTHNFGGKVTHPAVDIDHLSEWCEHMCPNHE
jgi:hypothetical protein